jgi:hypothetical protein
MFTSQSSGYRIRDRHPLRAKLLLYQIDPIRQCASCAQEYRMRFHACDFLIVDVATVPPALMETAIGVMDAAAEEGCRPESAPELGAFTFVPPGSFSE